MYWESTDKRTDKERFFDGLYSIPADDNDELETSESTLLLSASRGQRGVIRHFIPRRSRTCSTILGNPRAPSIARGYTEEPKILKAPHITRASTMPTLKTTGLASTTEASILLQPVSNLTRSSPPPESSRMLSSPAAVKALKRKRPAKTVPASSTKKPIFQDFVPNDLKNPARKFRIQKTDEHGGFCLNEWREKNITHVIVDACLKYEDVLKLLKKENIPEHIIVVNESFIGDCLEFNRIINYDQPQYKVSGHGSALYHKPPEPSPSAPNPPLPPQSQIKLSVSRRRIVETPQSTQISSSFPQSIRSELPEVLLEEEKEPRNPAVATVVLSESASGQTVLKETALGALGNATLTPGVSVSVLEPASEQRVQEALSAEIALEVLERGRPRDDLDLMIEEAQKIGDLPLSDDEGGSGKKSSYDQQETSSEDEDSLTRAKKKKISSKQSKSEKLGWQSKFQCMQKNDGTQGDANPNKRTIEILLEMQKYYEMIKDQWRSLSYRKAIATLRKQERKIIFASEAQELFGIGPSLAEKIEEIVRTDHLRKLDYAKLEPADAALKLFLGIYGVGPSIAHKWVQMGYKTLDDIKANVKLSESQKIGLDHYDDFACRIPRDEVKRHGDVVMEVAALIDPGLQLEIMGSYRRGAKDCGDIDIMITKKGADAHWLSGVLDELVERLSVIGFLQCGLAIPRGRDDGSKWHGASTLSDVPYWRRIDFLVVPWDERGAALLYFTGNDIFNRSMRLLASKKGYRLNQRGLFKNVMRGPQRQKMTNGTKVEGEDEKRIFEILEIPYRTPEERIC